MAMAWYGALLFALGEREVVAEYERETGRPFLLAGARSGLDRMIDKATGAEAGAANDFVDWFNTNVWGEDPFNGEERPDR